MGDKINFLHYTAEQGKHYNTNVEFEVRQANYKRADLLINGPGHNTIVMKHNVFSDWT